MISKEQVEECLKEFTEDEIDWVEKGGMSLAYVSHSACTRRLIEVFGGEWTWEIMETETKILCPRDTERLEYLIRGRLTCCGVSREAWGGAVCYGEHGDALKSAGSYALRKAASLFGIGLHLWENPPKKPGETNYKEPRRRNQSGEYPLTERQMNAIMAMSRVLGWTPEQTDREAMSEFRKKYASLSKHEASSFIGLLKERIQKVDR